MTATATLAGPTDYERIATGLLATDPAASALYWGAVTAEDGRGFDEIELRPKHWLAITVVRYKTRVLDAAHRWLSEVADGPLIQLGERGGQWMYLVDAAGLDRLFDADLCVGSGRRQRAYLDTGVVTFLPWRSLGCLLADADEARHLALKCRERGHGALKLHVSAAELAELGLAIPGAVKHEPDAQPIYRPAYQPLLAA